MSDTLRLTLLRDIPEDADLRRQWNALVARVPRPQVFYTYEWAVAVQRAYGATLHPLIFLAHDEQDELCGVAALTIDDGGRVSFLCATTGDYCDFLSPAEYKVAFVEMVLSALKEQGVAEIILTNLPEDSDSTVAVCRGSTKSGYHRFQRTAYVCAQIFFAQLDRHGQTGKLVAPGLKRVRRLEKALAGEGLIQVDHCRSWNDVKPVLPEFFEAHVVRFLELGRMSNLAAAQRRIFLTELAKLLSEPRWLVLSRMSVAQRVIAWHYGFLFHDTWFWYQPTFDSSVEKHWPGFCLLSQVIQEATENPVLTNLDLGLGSEAYKAKFANASRETLYIALHRALWRHVATVARDRTAAAVRARPGIDRFAKSLRERLRELRRDGIVKAVERAAISLFRMFWIRDEIVFFEWTGKERISTPAQNVQLRALTFADLATAAMQYEDDQATLRYLLRSAQRLRKGDAEGFVLMDAGDHPVHFAWVSSFSSFLCSELNANLSGDAEMSILFDCWTPPAVRGLGYFKHAIRGTAALMQSRGRRLWSYCLADDRDAVKLFESAGFDRRYSVTRQRIFGWQRIKGETPKVSAASAAEVSAHV